MASPAEMPRVVVVGCGKLGETLVMGWLEAGLLDRDHVGASVKTPHRAREVGHRLGLSVSTRSDTLVADADVVVLATKPQVVGEVLAEVGLLLRPGTLLISVAAGVPLARIVAEVTPGVSVIRAMPNTPCLIRTGMTVLAPGRGTSADHTELATRLFQALGRVRVLDEKHMDAVTALSASGPAFVYMVIESLAEGGVKVGLPRDVATELAAQMVLGSAKMVLETGSHPALLKDMVTTPAGCTVDGILELEEGGLRVTLIKAIAATTRRAGELAR